MTGLPKDHPLIQREYIVPTHSIERLLNSIIQWLDHGVLGAIVYGHSRVGKSSGIDFIRSRLAEVLDEPMPTLVVEGIEERMSATPKDFWTGILEDIGSPFATCGTARDARRRVISTFHGECLKARARRLMLIVDDAQYFQEIDLAKLVDLRKQLRRRKINLFVLLVGQEELALKPGTLSGTSKWPIVGRFMQEILRFDGCDLDDDLYRVLDAFDSMTEYPEGSGISFTHAATRRAWAAGFRFVSVHDDLKSAIETQRTKLGGLATTEYAMPPIMNTANALLRHLSSKDSKKMRVTNADVTTCVKQHAGALLTADLGEP